MQEFAERLSKTGRYILYAAVAVAIIQMILNSLGFDVHLPVITELIEMSTKLLTTLFRSFNNLLRSGHPL